MKRYWLNWLFAACMVAGALCFDGLLATLYAFSAGMVIGTTSMSPLVDQLVGECDALIDLVRRVYANDEEPTP